MSIWNTTTLVESDSCVPWNSWVRQPIKLWNATSYGEFEAKRVTRRRIAVITVLRSLIISGKSFSIQDNGLNGILMEKWTFRDSNPGPFGYEPTALPSELNVLSRGVHCSSREESSSTVAIHTLSVATKGLMLLCVMQKSIRDVWSPFSHPRWDRWNLWRAVSSWKVIQPAGLVGFEPTNNGAKIRCLTIWR